MEIVGIGTDIIECLRIGRMIEQHGELFLSRVYTPREIRYCQARKNAIEHFAGRWAAKEVRNDFSGMPRVHICGAARDQVERLHITEIMLSISHCRAYATATAIA